MQDFPLLLSEVNMFYLFKRLFGGGARKSERARRFAHLEIEAFESRDLMNAAMGPMHSFGPVFAGITNSQAHVSMPMHTTAGDSSGYPYTSSSAQTLTATLTGASGTSGTVTFIPSTTAGQNSLTVTVAGLAASQTYSVEVGGATVGQVVTNSSGNGSITLNNVTATIAAGTTVTVVDTSTAPATTVLTGSLTDTFSCHAQQGLSATLTGATGTSGSAFYSSSTDSGANNLRITVAGLTPNTTYTIKIGTTTVGVILTNSNGDATESLSNLTASVASGNSITISDSSGNTVLSGTFATGNAGNGPRARH
jgi:hypothetical protein